MFYNVTMLIILLMFSSCIMIGPVVYFKFHLMAHDYTLHNGGLWVRFASTLTLWFRIRLYLLPGHMSVHKSAWPSGHGRTSPDFLHHESGWPGFDSRGVHGHPNRPFLRVLQLVTLSRLLLNTAKCKSCWPSVCRLCNQVRKLPHVGFGY